MGSSTIPKEGLIGPFPNSPDLGFYYRHATSIIPLTHYCPVLPIFSRENIKKPKGFLMFSVGVDKQHQAVMS